MEVGSACVTSALKQTPLLLVALLQEFTIEITVTSTPDVQVVPVQFELESGQEAAQGLRTPRRAPRKGNRRVKDKGAKVFTFASVVDDDDVATSPDSSPTSTNSVSEQQRSGSDVFKLLATVQCAVRVVQRVPSECSS